MGDQALIKATLEVMRASQMAVEQNSEGKLEFGEVVPSVKEMKKDGISDYETFEELIQALYVHLGHTAEMARQEVMASGGIEKANKEEISRKKIFDLAKSVDPVAKYQTASGLPGF